MKSMSMNSHKVALNAVQSRIIFFNIIALTDIEKGLVSTLKAIQLPTPIIPKPELINNSYVTASIFAKTHPRFKHFYPINADPFIKCL